MSSSFTVTESFTITHARYLASKVATDLLRLHRLYDGEPSQQRVNDYERELVALLSNDYVDNIVYGFKRNGKWIVAVKYYVVNGELASADDDPGGIKPGEDISSATFGSFLNYTSKWCDLSSREKEEFKKQLPFDRSNGEEPGVENGSWSNDRTYSAGGRGIKRSTITR